MSSWILCPCLWVFCLFPAAYLGKIILTREKGMILNMFVCVCESVHVCVYVLVTNSEKGEKLTIMTLKLALQPFVLLATLATVSH